MSETLRELVVSLSLNSDNFTRNIKSINKQIQEAESAFRLASAGVENFETTTAGLSSKLSTLQRTFQLLLFVLRVRQPLCVVVLPGIALLQLVAGLLKRALILANCVLLKLEGAL